METFAPLAEGIQDSIGWKIQHEEYLQEEHDKETHHQLLKGPLHESCDTSIVELIWPDLLDPLQNIGSLHASSIDLSFDQTTLPLLGQPAAIGDMGDTEYQNLEPTYNDLGKDKVATVGWSMPKMSISLSKSRKPDHFFCLLARQGKGSWWPCSGCTSKPGGKNFPNSSKVTLPLKNGASQRRPSIQARWESRHRRFLQDKAFFMSPLSLRWKERNWSLFQQSSRLTTQDRDSSLDLIMVRFWLFP